MCYSHGKVMRPTTLVLAIAAGIGCIGLAPTVAVAAGVNVYGAAPSRRSLGVVAKTSSATDTRDPTDETHPHNLERNSGKPEARRAEQSSTHVATQVNNSSAQRANRKTKNSKTSAKNLSEIVVHGTLGSLLRQAATKRYSLGIVDSISAEEVGTFPDQTVAGALQRIPGVSINRSLDGVPNEVTVRGFGPQFVSVLLNGNRVASATFSRSFNFQVLPAQLIRQVLVYKTSRADLVAGGLGGTVDVRTWQPLDFQGFHGAAKAGANLSVLPGQWVSKYKPDVSAIVGDTYNSNKFGWLFAVDYSQRDIRNARADTSGWKIVSLPETGTDKKYHVPDQWREDVFYHAITSVSMNAAVEWQPVQQFKASFNLLWTRYVDNAFMNDLNVFTQTRNIKSITVDADDVATSFKTDGTGTWQLGSRPQYVPQPQKGVTSTLNLSYSPSTQNQLIYTGRWSNAWIHSNTDENASMNNVWLQTGRTLVWTNRSKMGLMPLMTGFSSPTAADTLASHADAASTDETGNPNVTDHILENDIVFHHEFLTGVISQINIGGDVISEHHTRIDYATPERIFRKLFGGGTVILPPGPAATTVEHFGSVPGGAGYPRSWAVSHSIAGIIRYLSTPEAYNQLPPAARDQFLSVFQTYNGNMVNTVPVLPSFSAISENDKEAFASMRFESTLFSLPWNAVVGIRYARTRTAVDGYRSPVIGFSHPPGDTRDIFAVFGPLSRFREVAKYDYWLPSMNFKLQVTSDVNFHLAYSKTLARPALADLSSTTSVSFAGEDRSVTEGNPGLKPLISKNYDVGAGWFFSGAGYVSFDWFEKKANGFATNVTTPGVLAGVAVQVTKPTNLNSTTVRGYEATFNYQFSWLPGAWKGFGITTNYTHVHSGATALENTILGEHFGIPGVGNSYNASLFYQWHGFSGRVAYNHRAAYLLSITGGHGLPETQVGYGELDLAVNFALNKHFGVYFDANNLTNERLYAFSVVPQQQDYADYFGRRYDAGVKVTF